MVKLYLPLPAAVNVPASNPLTSTASGSALVNVLASLSLSGVGVGGAKVGGGGGVGPPPQAARMRIKRLAKMRCIEIPLQKCLLLLFMIPEIQLNVLAHLF